MRGVCRVLCVRVCRARAQIWLQANSQRPSRSNTRQRCAIVLLLQTQHQVVSLCAAVYAYRHLTPASYCSVAGFLALLHSTTQDVRLACALGDEVSCLGVVVVLWWTAERVRMCLLARAALGFPWAHSHAGDGNGQVCALLILVAAPLYFHIRVCVACARACFFSLARARSLSLSLSLLSCAPHKRLGRHCLWPKQPVLSLRQRSPRMASKILAQSSTLSKNDPFLASSCLPV